MKVYVAAQDREFMPKKCAVQYPPNNTNRNYTVEQDFLNFLYDNDLVTGDYATAQWVYIPVYWQRHCYNNNYYLGETGLERIQAYLERITRDPGKRYFTVCCIDNGPLGTPHRRGPMRDCYIFNGCIGDQEVDDHRIFNVPLITSEWKGGKESGKRYLASFVGRADTHPVRQEMFGYLQGRPEVLMYDGYLKDYARTISESYLCLCPRGNGITSFRFFEAMQLGVVPVLISDHDVRPFQESIPWDAVSLYARTVEEVESVLTMDKGRLLEMGEKAKEVYYDSLTYGKWCRYVIRQLQALDGSGEPVLESAGHRPRNPFARFFRRYR